MADERLKRLVLAAMLAALAAVATMALAIPIPNFAGAYLNVGDAVVYVSALLLGGPLGGLAAGAGSAIADVLLGSGLYAPATFVIKGCMAWVAGVLLKKGWAVFPSLLLAGAVMPLGYFLYETALYGAAAAAAGLPFNLIQHAAGVLLGGFAVRTVRHLIKHGSQ